MGTKKRILVAEDEKSLAKAMELKLTRAGFQVKTVSNGEEVIEALKTETFDLLVMDLIMPKKDGFTTLEELKQQNNKIPIIVTSNLGQNEDIQRAKSLGAINYLIKSNTSIAQIVIEIEKALT